MKKQIGLLVAFAALIIMLGSCNSNNEIAKMIPQNAQFVVSVNMHSLGDKVSWNDIKNTSWFQKAYSDSSTADWRKKLLDNPQSSGIDFDKDLVMFTNKTTDNEQYIVVQGVIKNEKDFEQFNLNFDPSQKVTKSGDVSLLVLKDKNVIGWKGEHFAYVMNVGSNGSELYEWDHSDDTPNQDTPKDKSADLSNYCKKLFSLKKDSSLAKNEKFSKLLKDKGDVHVWQNTEATMKDNAALGMVSMLKLDVFFKNNFSALTVNFEKGKMEIDQKQYMGKELIAFMKKYGGSKINKKMISNLPSQNVLGLFIANFKPQGLEELIKLTGADGLANMFLQQSGFNLSDISKAIDGNMMIAFTDLQMKENSKNSTTNNFQDGSDSSLMNITQNIPDFKMTFSMGVKNQTEFQKIFNAGKKLLANMPNDTSINMVLNDKYFVVGNSPTFVNQYLAGTNDNKYSFMDEIDGHAMGGFIDIHKILSLLSSQKDFKNEERAMIDQSLKVWNNASMKAGDIDDDALKAEIEIKLMDQNTNSLKVLNSYIDEMFKINEARMKNDSGKMKLDSILSTPPPMDTVSIK